MLASGGRGWHSKVGLHLLRLAVSGVLAAHPRLKPVIGHQREMLPFILQRFDGALGGIGLETECREDAEDTILGNLLRILHVTSHSLDSADLGIRSHPVCSRLSICGLPAGSYLPEGDKQRILSL